MALKYSRSFFAILLSSLAMGGLPTRASAASATPTTAPEQARATQVKAAFLHKFASFVDWPEGSFVGADSPLRIGVMGDPQLFQDLTELARDRSRDGRPVTVTLLAAGDALAGFHILYLRPPTVARLPDLLAQVPEGVLTVADTGAYHPRGSVMSFFMEDGRVRFGVSLDAAQRQRLRLSSRLLTVARNVQSSAEGQDTIVGQLCSRPLS